MTAKPSQLQIAKGASILYGDQEYVIVHVTGLDQVLARNLRSGEIETLPIPHLMPPPEKGAAGDDDVPERNVDLVGVSSEDWQAARDRLELIKPLLYRQERGLGTAKKIAADSGIGFVTLYKWRSLYLGSGLLSSLLPTKRDGGRKKPRLAKEVEAIVTDVIDNFYLTDERHTISAVMEELEEKFDGTGLKVPHINTIRTRIAWKGGRDVVAARYGERAASMRFDPNEGQPSDADWPLAMVQIDHTELPVMIVHDITRQTIGRPWVTLPIDVFSRVIPGMYLTLEHPSAMSAGMCVSHAILPKEKWLAELGIEADWPCWGVMGALHMDNAREFRGNMLRAACEEYGIDLKLRPVTKPHYGGHIERLMGTVSEELKKVPGKTFSGPKEKGEYDSEGRAVMTLSELEEWLTLLIAKYHHRLHKGIGTSPLQKYREGLLGSKGKPGRGLPARRLDEEKVRIDFMPFEERTIQDYGVLWDVHYFADVLRPWVNAPDPGNPRAKRQFRFRRDPRDISELYFFEPTVHRYFVIPYRDISQPPISIWELREAKKEAKRDGIKDIDDRVIFEYAKRMRQVVESATIKTKAARKQQQRQSEHEKSRKKRMKELPKAKATLAPAASPPKIEGYDPAQIKPLDED